MQLLIKLVFLEKLLNQIWGKVIKKLHKALLCEVRSVTGYENPPLRTESWGGGALMREIGCLGKVT